MTSQQFLVCDSSTLANFKSWAQAISSFFTTAGWSKSTDTGQVNWGTIASVPGSGAYVYEIWEPNDGLTNFFLRVEYGNYSGQANCPTVRLSVGTSTDGAGNLTGQKTQTATTVQTSYTAPSTTATYECDFSGALGRIGAMLWRNGTNACQSFFAVERSVNSSGAYTGSYVTIWTCGNAQFGTGGANQMTLYFSIGETPDNINVGGNHGNGGWISRACVAIGQSTTRAFNGSIPFDTCSPFVGFFDYPCTVCGVGLQPDIAEGITFTVTLYGSTRTYLPSYQGNFNCASPLNGTNPSSSLLGVLCMRYD